MLLSWHNIAYFQDLTRRMREAIKTGEFAAFRKQFNERWQEGQAQRAAQP